MKLTCNGFGLIVKLHNRSTRWVDPIDEIRAKIHLKTIFSLVTLVVTALPLLIIPPTLLVTATRAAIHGHCCQVHRIWFYIVHCALCWVLECCPVLKDDEPTPVPSPPGEVQAISGGAPPGVPCHLGLPRHHHWQRPTKVILYMETI